MCLSQRIWQNCKSKVVKHIDTQNLVLIFYLVSKFYPDHMANIPADTQKFEVSGTQKTWDAKSDPQFVSDL